MTIAELGKKYKLDGKVDVWKCHDNWILTHDAITKIALIENGKGLYQLRKDASGKPLYNKLKNAYDKTVDKKAMGGMMEARKKGMGLRMANGGEAKFPDLSGDGKITQKDILMGRGVIKKAEGGVVKKRVKRTKKSRGTGSAIKGTKFKGVF